MAGPRTVKNRTVIVGGGLHAAVIAATFAACGKEPPIVVERRDQTGGMFADLDIFKMNSANAASIRSVLSPGPTRIRPLSPSDDLNWIPNVPASEQVRSASGMAEYPYSNDMAKLIQRVLDRHAEVYLSTEMTFDRYGSCSSPSGSVYYGDADRVIFAGGLVEPPNMPKGPAIMSGYAFMKKPIRNLGGLKIALNGGGDTAAQCAEYMIGEGVRKPETFPDQVDWYGGEVMPTTKETWMRQIHARWAAIGRHLPERNDTPSDAIFRPYQERAQVTNLGDTAWVNAQVYDLAIMATGFRPAPCPVPMSSSVKIQDRIVARMYDTGDGRPRVFRVGTAAELNANFQPFTSRFPAAKEAIYNLAPRTAAFAASLD